MPFRSLRLSSCPFVFFADSIAFIRRLSRCDGEAAGLAEFVGELAPGLAAVGGAEEVAADAGGEAELGDGRVEGEVPDSAVGSRAELDGFPGPAAVGRAIEGADAAGRSVADPGIDGV